MRVFTSQPAKQELLLFQKTTADMNSTADQAFTRLFGFTSFFITRIRALNSSGSLTTAAGGIYTGAAKAGNALVAAGQAYATLTGATVGMDLTIAGVGNGLQTITPILSLTTGQGSAMTCDMYIIGVPLT